MNRLLRIEWNKMFYNKGTRIFLILYVVLILLIGLILPNIQPVLNGVKINLIDLGALEFPVIWHNIAWLVAFGKFFLAIIIINNISNEYTFGTFKQNTIDGLSRLNFFLSKLFMNILIVAFSTLLVVAIVTILGLYFAKELNYFQGIEFVAGYFIEVFAFVSFIMFLAFLLKKSTFAILSLFVLYIFESILRAMEAAIKYSTGMIKDPNYVLKTNFLPFTSNSNIVDFPPASITGFLTGGKFFTESHVAWEYFAINIFYILLFLGLSYFIVKKRDL